MATASRHVQQSRIISPSRSDLASLRQPLTPGEWEVIDFFDERLPLGWEIYVQPHLNGLRPDIVLLHPNVGIAVFEIKDWNLDAMSYYAQGQGSHAQLWSKKDGRAFPNEANNPFTKIKLYKQRIFDLYCPRLPAGKGYAVITAGVIFTRAAGQRARALRVPFLLDGEMDHADRYLPVSGMDDLARGDLEAVFPDAHLGRSSFMDRSKADDLRAWLVEPDHAAEQRRPVPLDPKQRQLVDIWPRNGFRRIKGPAGSGKSLVLAARAAKLAAEGKSVLIVTFNITLWHYLRDIVVRMLPDRRAAKMVEYTHFHLWCDNVCRLGAPLEIQEIKLRLAELAEASRNRPATQAERDERDDIIENRIPELTHRTVLAGLAQRYDAIMVDEGQDMRPSWWNVLKDARSLDGQMLLVADTTQDVYGKAASWTDEAMQGAGFVGEWSRLDTCYRLPREGRMMADRFALDNLDGNLLVLQPPDQDVLDIEPFHPRWVQCRRNEAAKRCVTEILRMKKCTGLESGLSMSDIVFICNDLELGRAVSVDLATYDRIRVVHTFSENQEERKRQKQSLFMGRESIKATTLLSFKGWESRLLVVYIGETDGRHRQASVYAALTRIKRDARGSWMTVVCSDPSLEEFGRPWV